MVNEMANVLNHRIDFKVVFSVAGANPNGDPLNGNRPRQTSDGYGEVSDVAIKRKLRNRLQEMGEKIFVQSQDRADDGLKSLKARADSVKELKGQKDESKYQEVACQTWFDVRAFGQVFAFDKGSSVGVRGPVSIQTARSITPIMINDMQITKSVNSKDAAGRSSDTMGMKYSIDYAVYQFNGSINVQLAEKTGFTEEDANAIHEALKTLLYNDESSARPAGSMEVLRVYWWEHKNKLGDESPAKIFRTVEIKPNEGVDVVKSTEDIDWGSADSAAKTIQCDKLDIFED
ncbi:type I-C CRISPR-associated protein Cas7/Csd2 [Lactobacillus delbrueckii]|uniref:CRISPR-associated protein n=2 Tax=Lactobacillus delbrueckii TaxID=1584 RepID=A0ABD0AE24_9LACO|nr:type I-C CRISPR-associated protein Cas7/Csd2 [Lactobacillus delbrueckii]GHN19351.1 type I-C CRISPR-associated protein Cas7/Csd2 [Lactobacillus delbrueckii]GHN33196.1 CRISPR-associated protein [Lactobacillus delbrueckii]GHN41205.1 CRISPR-associated protein [Lactobacillus delbrueckii]